LPTIRTVHGLHRGFATLLKHFLQTRVVAYQLEVFMDLQNKLSQSAAVTAGIAAAGLAVGAAVMGAFAIGALAIAALAMRKVATRGAHVDRLNVGELTADRLLVKDSVSRD
jgi:hypothetical protein